MQFAIYLLQNVRFAVNLLQNVRFAAVCCKLFAERAVCCSLLANAAILLQNARFVRIAKDHIRPPRSYGSRQFAANRNNQPKFFFPDEGFACLCFTNISTRYSTVKVLVLSALLYIRFLAPFLSFIYYLMYI